MLSDFVISIILTVFGCFLSSLSLVLMKVAHNKNKREISIFKLLEWWAGMLTLIVGSVINVVALGYGNQLMLASSSSISIIFNTLLSVFMLKEKFFKSDGIAISIICIGSILFLSVAKDEDESLDENKLASLYWRPISLMYITASLGFVVWAYLFDSRTKNQAL